MLTTHGRNYSRWTPAAILGHTGSWNAAWHCGPLAPLIGQAPSLESLGVEFIDGAQQADGWTKDSGEFATPAFRPFHIGAVALRPDRFHWKAPQSPGVSCVQPGDVVVSKLPPIRAAWITRRAHQHPIDTNCAIVRGLDRAHGFWLALCVSQPVFGEFLLRRSTGSVIPRMATAALGDVPLPPPPAEAEMLSRQVAECLDARLANLDELHHLQADAEAAVADTVWDATAADRLAAMAGSWQRFFAAADVDDSLVPGHVALNRLQRRLRDEARWVNLRQLLRRTHLERPRLSGDEEQTMAPMLRLSDVGDDLAVPATLALSRLDYVRRVYAEPLKRDEVLLSSLVSNPRVAFVARPPRGRMLVSDHWQRLEFRDTPAAWALVLGTAPVREQLRWLAVGTFQQFATAGVIGRLVLPPLPLKLRLHWDTVLRRYLDRQADLEGEWRLLRRRADEMLRTVLAGYDVYLEGPAERAEAILTR